MPSAAAGCVPLRSTEEAHAHCGRERLEWKVGIMYESEEAESRVRKEPNARLSSVAVRDAGSERSCKVSTLLHILLMLLTVRCTANFHLYLYAEAWVLQAQKSSKVKVFPGWGQFVICTCHVIRRGPGRRSRTGATQPMI